MKKTRIAKIAMLSVAMAALIALAAWPSAAAVTTNEILPLSLNFTNSCNGDEMATVGRIHLLATSTIDAAGIHTDVHFNELQARDTDLTTGIECTDTGNLHQSGLNFIFTLPIGTPGNPSGDLPITLTVTLGENVNCPSGAGSQKISLLTHLTINPDGTVTIFFDNSPGVVKCNGPG